MAETPHRRTARWGFDTALIVLFLAGIASPVTMMLAGRPEESNRISTEYRRSVPFPQWAWDAAAAASFPERFNAYLDDHFGLREPLIRWHNRLMVFGLGQSPLPKLVVGDHPWLYFNGDPYTGDASPVEDYLGIAPLSPAKLEFIRWMFQDQQAWLREHGKAYLLVLIPSKPGLYPEYLPKRLRPTGLPSWREQVIDYLAAHTDVPVLDLTPALRDARQRHRVYDPTDTHWNEYGGLTAARTILETLQASFPSLQVPEESAFRIVARPESAGDLARMVGVEDRYAIERIRVERKEPPRAQPVPHGEGEFVAVSGGVRNPALPRAMVYRDSFADRITPFLTEHFDWIEYEWGQNGSKMTGIETRDADIVLQIMVDRVLNMNLFYAERIQKEMNRRRFDQAAVTLAVYEPANDFGGLEPIPPLAASLDQGGLVLDSPRPVAKIRIPSVPEPQRLLPILRLAIRPSAKSVLRITEDAGVDAVGRPVVRPLARHLIYPGINALDIPLFDPESHVPLTLELEGDADYILYALEIRGYPR